jgi:hypothetical protein
MSLMRKPGIDSIAGRSAISLPLIRTFFRIVGG